MGTHSDPAIPREPLLSKVLDIALRPFMFILWNINKRADRDRISRAIVPRPDDIFIVTYPKSGTTWMQMILYQLATDGNMDIPHISHFAPWLEFAVASKRDLEALPSPRIFKSHLEYSWIPKGPCKYIYVIRDGKDVVVSYFHHELRSGFHGDFSVFFDHFIRGTVPHESWFRHVAGWWAHKDDPNVLILMYEDLKQDLEGCIRKIAAFCGFEVDPARLPTIVERCGFAFMKQYESKFDPVGEVETEDTEGPPKKAEEHRGPFLRTGQTGTWKEYMSSQQIAAFEQALVKHLGGTSLLTALSVSAQAQQPAQPDDGSPAVATGAPTGREKK